MGFSVSVQHCAIEKTELNPIKEFRHRSFARISMFFDPM